MEKHFNSKSLSLSGLSILYLYVYKFAALYEMGGEGDGRLGRGNLGGSKFILPTLFLACHKKKLRVGGAKSQLFPGRSFRTPL